jgi:hypothetical protein
MFWLMKMDVIKCLKRPFIHVNIYMLYSKCPGDCIIKISNTAQKMSSLIVGTSLAIFPIYILLSFDGYPDERLFHGRFGFSSIRGLLFLYNNNNDDKNPLWP